MIRRILTGGLLCACLPVAAQQKNVIKLNIGDCINCVSAMDYVLRKDPTPFFVIKDQYIADSMDVLEKFDLQPHCGRIIWSTKLYDSLSRVPESELIQFCGSKEVSRSGLKRLVFIENNCSQDSSGRGGTVPRK